MMTHTQIVRRFMKGDDVATLADIVYEFKNIGSMDAAYKYVEHAIRVVLKRQKYDAR